MKRPAWLSRFRRRMRIKMRRRPPRRVEPSLQAPAVPAVVNHDGVREADPYGYEAAHRRMAWLLRLSVMINVALASVAVIEGSAIAELVPLQKLKLGLVRIEPSTDRVVKVDPASLVRIEPIIKDTPGYDLLMDSYVRRYVRVLLEIDKLSQDSRMHEANINSDRDFWVKFIRERYSEIKKAIQTGLVRSIVVTNSERISRRNNIDIYAVDFTQTDQREGKTVEVKNLRAYLSVTTRPRTVPLSEKYENPAGFTTIDLVLKERGNS